MTEPAPPAPSDPSADHHGAERVALIVGLLIAAGAIGGIAVLGFVTDDVAPRAVLQISTHAVIGRETGIPAGLALGLPVPLVAALAAAQDLTILLIGYPVAAAIGRGALRIPFLDKLVHKPHPKRDAFARRTEVAGVSLLGLSLWIPFFPGGALLAALLSRAAGYHPRLFLPVLAASALVADLVYVVLVHRIGQVIGTGAVLLLAAGIVVAIGIGVLARRWLRRHPT